MASTASLTAGRSGRVLHLAEEEWKQLNPHGRFPCPCMVLFVAFAPGGGSHLLCFIALLCEWLREFEFFVYGGETTRKHRAALAALVAPFRSSVGSRARAVIGKAGYTKRYL